MNNESSNSNEELEELFGKWIKKQKNDDNNTGIFSKDGYINEAEYNKKDNKERILFILKEPHIYNEDNKPEQKKGAVIEDSQEGFYNCFFNKEMDDKEIYTIKNNIIIPVADANPEEANPIKRFKLFDNNAKMKEKMARMAYYILHDGEITSDYNELKSALSKVAYMNINKMGGSDRTNGKELDNYFYEYKDYIFKEIDLINPSVIVVMTKGSHVFNEIKNKYNDKKIIEMVHTGIMPQYIKNDENEIAYFNKKYCKNYADLMKNWDIGENNIFNKTSGPFLRFHKSTLKYLIKLIYKYNNI